MKWCILLLSCFSLVIYADEASQRNETQLRIQPIGQVSVEQPLVSTETKIVAPPSKTAPGQTIYEQHCIVCHKEGLAGAPKFRNESDWKPRLTDKTLDDLVASSLKGLNAMPIKGTCMKCTEEDLKAAITYMLPQS